MTECIFGSPKASEEEEKVCGQHYSEVTCSSSLLNAGIDGKLELKCHFRSELYSKVEREPKDEVATIEGEFKFRKMNGPCCFGSLITVPLHLTSAK